MTSRKKPGVAYWATVGLVVVLVGYPLTFGPACWLVRHERLSATAAAHAYRPILRGSKLGPAWMLRAAMWYGGSNEYDEPTFMDLDNVLFRESWE